MHKKLKGKVGVVVPKSIKTRVVGLITYKVRLYACNNLAIM